MGDVEPVGEGVSELRIHVGAGWRIYFTKRGEQIVVLLIGGSKKTQSRDIKKAKTLAATLK
jgi:putative addiction module killer protein